MGQPTRPATDSDRDPMAETMQAAIAGVAGPYSDRQRQAWIDAATPELFALDSAVDDVLVVERAGTVCGLGWLSVAPDETAYLDPIDAEVVAIYVRPLAAGAGVGTAIYESLEATARDRGCATIGCWASLNAVPFYERLGFERVTERDLEYETVTLPVLEMRRVLE